ncbi:MAG: aminotransferase class V-fold PLP-dependent enzyme [candidate division Zixibacteria bacterium]|nr:aminotransferase class V-fold PLP-dependent enzyme [candidate division Zixibacteria bacterium]
MELDQFRKHAHELVDWMADYLTHVRDYPVKSQIQPRQILDTLPTQPPTGPESFNEIFQDFQKIILPGMTHWQHPSFFGYFPANSSPPSVLAEMLTATLGAQCMNWQTSPAAAELEERVMQWLREMIGLPSEFTGVIQDTASTATLCSILTAREKLSAYAVNEKGFGADTKFTVYCSTEAHSSVEKAVKIAGLGRENLRKVRVDDQFALDPADLDLAIQRDLKAGYRPLCVVATLGTTGSLALDPIRQIGEICRRHNMWLHVDAAMAGTALILPEFQWIADGLEMADTFVFNPHKWMLTNFDCSAYFVRDKDALLRTFEILPEYLKTPVDSQVNNYRDWGIQLGRRFRALKLWFVIRAYGAGGIQSIVRNHIHMAQSLAAKIQISPNFELLASTPLNLVCFRLHPRYIDDPARLNELNERLERLLNDSGKLFLTHTKLGDAYALRIVIGQTQVRQVDVDLAWEMIQKTSQHL